MQGLVLVIDNYDYPDSDLPSIQSTPKDVNTKIYVAPARPSARVARPASGKRVKG